MIRLLLLSLALASSAAAGGRARATRPVAPAQLRLHPAPGLLSADGLAPSASAAGPAGTAPAVEPERLRQALLERLQIEDSPLLPAREIVESMSRSLVASPTARILTRLLLRQSEGARIAFDNGRGDGFDWRGRTSLEPKGVLVTLNAKSYADPSFVTGDGVTFLGHELLGHGLPALAARKAGLFQQFTLYDDHELGGRLVEWTIGAELGLDLSAKQALWNFRKDPAKYRQELRFLAPQYALSFGPNDEDYRGILERRIALTQERLAMNATQRRTLATWPPVIRHLIKDHALAPGAFKDLELELQAEAGVRERRESLLRRIQADLERSLAEFSSEKGAQLAAALRRSFQHPFFARYERFLGGLKRRLGNALQLRPPLATPVLGQGKAYGPGSLTWLDLRSLHRRDVDEHPEHWRSIAE